MSPVDPSSSNIPAPRIHFAPGELMLFVKHRPGLSAANIVEAVTKLRPFPPDIQLPGLSEPPKVYLSPQRVTMFDESRFVPHKIDNGLAFSLVFADIPALQNEELLLLYLQYVRRRIQSIEPVDGFAFQATTPNWLACGAAQNNGSGGPSGKPVVPTDFITTKPLPSAFDTGISADPRGACVDVFILDTAPCDIDLKNAYDKWVDQPLRGVGDYNARLDALIGPSGALGYIYGTPRIQYAGHTHLLELANAFLPKHDYVMSDHGLFVASVINEYAPGARLHLVESLNPFGVGTLESIANGFATAADYVSQFPGTKVVVNASLFLDVGQPDLDSLKLLIEHDPFWERFIVDENGNEVVDEAELNRMVEPLRLVCEFLRDNAAIAVVAAAGNDGVLEEGVPKHPLARFPAAYSTVTGVGARNFDDTVADYSNEPDRPPVDGIGIFGGNVVGDNSDPALGVLGVYIGTFPDRSPNDFGLARWSGTSFATPMVTGIVAGLICDEIPIEEIVPAIKQALGQSNQTVPPEEPV